MNKNKKILKLSLFLIIITMIVSIGITYYLRLDNPVFLKSYIGVRVYENDVGFNVKAEFQIRYITNENDTRMVNHIEFEEIPEFNIRASEINYGFGFFNTPSNMMPGEAVGTYSIRTIYVEVDAQNLQGLNDELHLTNARVHFNNGDVIDVDIGDIVLYKYNKHGDHFEFVSGHSSSEGISSTQVKITNDIILDKVEIPFLDQTKDFIELKIDNNDYDKITGIEYKEGDYLRLESKIKTPEDILLKFSTYDSHPNLYYKDNEGNTFTYRFYNVDYKKYGFKYGEIIRYLRARGEI